MSTATRKLRSSTSMATESSASESDESEADGKAKQYTFTKNEIVAHQVDDPRAHPYVCRRHFNGKASVTKETWQLFMAALSEGAINLMAPAEDLPIIYGLKNEIISAAAEKRDLSTFIRCFCVTVDTEYHEKLQSFQLAKDPIDIENSLKVWRETEIASAADAEELAEGVASVVVTPEHPDKMEQDDGEEKGNDSLLEHQEGLSAASARASPKTAAVNKKRLLDLADDDDEEEDDAEDAMLSPTNSSKSPVSPQGDQHKNQKRVSSQTQSAALAAKHQELQEQQRKQEADREQLQNEMRELQEQQRQERLRAESHRQEEVEQSRRDQQRSQRKKSKKTASTRPAVKPKRILKLPGQEVRREPFVSPLAPRNRNRVPHDADWAAQVPKAVFGDSSEGVAAAKHVWSQRDRIVRDSIDGEAPLVMWEAITLALVTCMSAKYLATADELGPTLRKVLVTIAREAAIQLDDIGGLDAMYDVARKKARAKIMARYLRKRKLGGGGESAGVATQQTKFVRSQVADSLPSIRSQSNERYWALQEQSSETTTTTSEPPKQNARKPLMLEVSKKEAGLDSSKVLYGEWLVDLDTKSRVVTVLMSQVETLRPQHAELNRTLTKLANDTNREMASKINKKHAMMNMLLKIMDSNDEDAEAGDVGVQDVQHVHAPRLSKANRLARRAIIGWLICEANDENAAFLSFGLACLKYLKRLASVSSAQMHSHFNKTEIFVEVFGWIKEWLGGISPMLTVPNITKMLKLANENVALRVKCEVSDFISRLVLELTHIQEAILGVIASFRPNVSAFAAFLDKVQKHYLIDRRGTFYEGVNNIVLQQVMLKQSPFKSMDNILSNSVQGYVPQSQNQYSMQKREWIPSNTRQHHNQENEWKPVPKNRPPKPAAGQWEKKERGKSETQRYRAQLKAQNIRVDKQICMFWNLQSGCKKHNCKYDHKCVKCGQTSHIFGNC